MQIIPIELGFSNAYLVKDRKAILVDAGAPHEADKILNAVQRAGVDSREITLILQTHGHFDHAGSTAALQRKLGIPVAVHPSDAFMLRQGINGEIKPSNFEAYIVKAIVPKSFEPCEPDLLLEEEIALTDFGINGKVCFTPGHTQGSLSVWLENNEAILGDLMMGGWLGGALFGTQPNYHYFINDRNALHASMRRILALKPGRLYVGHGGPLRYDDVIQRFSKDL